MDIRKIQGQRLAKARTEAGYRSAREAALQNEWSESSYRAHENGTRTIGQDDAERYARRYRADGVKVSGRFILYGDSGAESTAEARPNVVTVVGRIGAGAEILPDFDQLGPEGLYEIEVGVPVSLDAIAFEVDGDSMWPRYEPGDIIICRREGSPVEQVINWEAAVRTEDGRRYLKRVRAGSSPGLYNLESHNAAPVLNVQLDWVAEVEHVVRVKRWKMLGREALSSSKRSR